MVRTLVLATDNVDPIPDGTVLYTCAVTVAPDAVGTYPLRVSGVIMADPSGTRVPNVGGVDGAVIVGGPPPTPTIP